MSLPPEIAEVVAANARRLRAARGWSLEVLADRSGVSKGMLVQIEQARTNPSLGTLCRLAEALSVSLAALIETSHAPAVRVVGPDEGTVLWSSAAGSWGRLLVGSDEREHVELWRWRLQPGDVHRSEGHLRGTVELVHVLAGELVVGVAGEGHPVTAGGAVRFRADRDHAYRNDGRRPCDLAMIVLQPDADLDVDLHTWAAEGLTAAPPGSG